MHFVILGGTGRTGSIVIDEAVARHHTVTALVRDPTKMQTQAGVTLVKGTPTSLPDVRSAFQQAGAPHPVDAVLVTLNAPRASESPFAKSIAPPRLMANSVQNATSAMKEFGVRKIVVMQSLGVGTSFANLNFLMRWIITKTEMSKAFDDHNAVDREPREAARDSSFQWAMLRPTMLKGEGFLPVKVLGDNGQGGSFMPQCSRQSVARFIIQDCAETDQYNGRTPVICN